MRPLDLFISLTFLLLISTTSLFNLRAKIPSEEVSLSLSTNKQTYRSHEPIFLSVLIDSPTEYTNAELRIRGIKSSRGTFLFKRDRILNLSRGLNNLTFSSVVPSCSPCSGIYPGRYSISAKLTLNN